MGELQDKMTGDSDNADRLRRVAAATWAWRAAGQVTEAPREAGTVRPALIQVAVMLVIVAILYHFEHMLIVKIVLVFATVSLVCGLFIPPAYRRIEQFGQFLGVMVGSGLTWILLLPFFYICFTIGRLSQLIRGKDPLHRACPTDDATYWIDRQPITRDDYYKRQY